MSTTTMTLAPSSSVQSLSSPPAPLATTTMNTIEQLYHQSSLNSVNSATNHNNNNNNSKSYAFYHFAHSGSGASGSANNDSEEATLYRNEAFHYKGGSYASLPGNEASRLLLDRSAFNGAVMPATSSAFRALHKSSSYSGTVRPKATILKQDSVNGRIEISLTDSDNDYASQGIGAAASLASLGGGGHGSCTIAGDGLAEDDAFLVCVPNAVSGTSAGGALAATAGGTATRRGGSAGSVMRTHGKSSTSWCYRAHAFISRNWYLSYLVPISILLALMLVAYATRDYAQRLLYWIETQNPWVIFALFMLLFIVVSFPVVVGYFVLMITAGYLFGLVKGFLTVCVGANMGIAVAHLTIRSFRHRIPMHKLIRNETGRAILRVISGPRAFKVVLFTRLTPIPFGLQNAIFGVSTINARTYHTATFLGLLPAQAINVYLGSTLRSMHEVLNNPGTATTGYISFGIEVVCGVALMFWVVQKARKELSETLLSDISTEGKLIDIEV